MPAAAEKARRCTSGSRKSNRANIRPRARAISRVLRTRGYLFHFLLFTQFPIPRDHFPLGGVAARLRAESGSDPHKH